MKNWYPVSLLTAVPRGDGTQSRNQSNEPPPGDSLLFKSDLMPLLSPILPRDPKGGGFNWLVHKTLNEVHFASTIKLNVGGKIYKTTLDTLKKDPDSMLCAMFSGRFELKADEDDGAYFIDRDAELFR